MPDGAITAEFDRLGVPESQRPMFTVALTQSGDVLGQLKECTWLGDLQSLADIGVIEP